MLDYRRGSMTHKYCTCACRLQQKCSRQRRRELAVPVPVEGLLQLLHHLLPLHDQTHARSAAAGVSARERKIT
jgi:hypothetical protein